MNDKLKLEKESHALQNEKLLFSKNVRVILTGNHCSGMSYTFETLQLMKTKKPEAYFPTCFYREEKG